MLNRLRDTYRLLRRMGRALQGRDLFRRAQVKLPTVRHGSGYGGWRIYPDPLDEESVVYSFGIGEDISFDLSLIETYGVQVHAFDPTPKSLAWLAEQKLPQEMHVHDFGVADFDGTAAFAAPEDPAHVSYSLRRAPGSADVAEGRVYRLRTIMERLGHTHVDLLKMDIEGAEYDVLQDLVDSRVDVRQLLVEFHHRFEQIGVEQTRAALAALNANGYRIFSVSPSGEEYSLIRR